MTEPRQMGVLRLWFHRTSNVEWLTLQRAVIRHFLAIVTLAGFLTLATLSIIGNFVIHDPTVTGFLGVALGFLSAKLDVVFKFYFGNGEAPPDVQAITARADA